jgi:integrase
VNSDVWAFLNQRIIEPSQTPFLASFSRLSIPKVFSEIESISGTRFTVHGLRRTYGQNLLNRGVQPATVSLMLGHNSTLTTEKHYCRKDPDSARLEVVNAFAESRNVPKVNPPVIETKETLPGYA